MLALGLALTVSAPVAAQLPIRTTTTTTARPTTSTTARQTTTTAPGPTTTTTAKPKPTTTAKPTTTEKPTTTIATPAQVSSTTTTTAPIASHNGHFSPFLSVLAIGGLVSGFGLLVLQWFLTKPGREGWTL